MASYWIRNTGDSVLLNFEVPSLRAGTAEVQPYLSSAQRDLTNKPQENIRKPIVAILAPKSDCENTEATSRLRM